MITLSETQLEKIRLLDRLFGSMGVDELRDFVESEQVVARLKGTEANPELFMKLLDENEILMHEVISLKTDFKALLKILNETVFSYNSEMNNLKQKYGIY